MNPRKPYAPPFIRKLADPKTICRLQAEEIGREFYRISQTPPGDQCHSAKRLHEHIMQALERYNHWAQRIDDVEWLDALWTPIFGYILAAVGALEEHLKVYPDPEIARTVASYRQALADLETNQTEPGTVEVALPS